MARSLNRVQLIGNLTRDPELRYTPTGTAVCTFGLATNRSWTTETGEKKEDAEFHKIVAWNKLGELCSQLLVKGRKVYVEGRIAYRKFTNKEGIEQNTTEIVIDDMMILDRKEGTAAPYEPAEAKAKPDQNGAVKKEEVKKEQVAAQDQARLTSSESVTMSAEEIADDIPF